jgi:hypothetical protein
VCAAKRLALTLKGVRVPKRAHHILCLKNTKTKGKGEVSRQQLEAEPREKCLHKPYNTPLAPHEREAGSILPKKLVNYLLLHERNQEHNNYQPTRPQRKWRAKGSKAWILAIELLLY